MTARFMTIQQAQADSNRVYELRMYHTFPNRLTPLVTRFRNGEVKVFEQNHMKFMGAWVPQDALTTRIFSSICWLTRTAKPPRKTGPASCRSGLGTSRHFGSGQQIVEKVESTFMDPVDFSPLK
jgi:hypothetical protein